MKRIRVLDSQGNEYFYPVDAAVAEISIGRSQSNDIILGSKTVSRHHAIIKINGDRVLLVNQSANGVMVDGARIDRVHEMQPGQVVTIDAYRVSVEGPAAPVAANGPAPAPSPSPSPVISRGPATSARPQPPHPTQPQQRTPGHRITEREPGSVSDADVEAFLGPIAPSRDFEEPRVNLAGQDVQIIDRALRAELVHLKSELHEALKERLDLHSFEITDYASPQVVRKVSTRLKELLSARQHLIPAPFTKEQVFKELMDEICGLGPIEDLIKHRKITEVMVVDRDHIYAELDGKLVLTDRFFNDEKSMMTVIERIVIPRGRRIDESTPLVDTRLADGSRVNAVIPPLALKDPCLTIRKFPEERLGIADLIRFASMTPEIAKFLGRSVRARKNIVISGGTGSGKTTLLNVLSSFIGKRERVVTIEDAAELQLQQEHVVGLETKPPNLEGKGEISTRELVKNALRMRPDRIVVGECRGGEALDMLQAMNTGHDGSMTTVHANNPREAISRLETLVLMSGMELPTLAIRQQIAGAVDIIVQQTRYSDGSRRISHVTEVVGIDEDGRIQLEEIYRYRQTGIDDQGRVNGYHLATGYLPSFVDEFIIQGLARKEDFF